MLIDTHCHLTDEKLAGNLEEVLLKANEAGVKKIVVPSTSLEDSKNVVKIAEKYVEVFGLVGIHPENIAHLSFSIAQLRGELAKLAGSSEKVVGIGEIGLDFHYDTKKKGKDAQIGLFKAQMELAIKLNLPVAIHMREAEEEMKGIITSSERLPRGQFHCWAGSEGLLKLVLDKGFYVSFCGNITYPSADNLRGLAKLVPLDRLLLETDSPYLSPEPVRGSVNIPSNVKILAEYLANLLRIPVETLINQTTKNAKCLYLLG